MYFTPKIGLYVTVLNLFLLFNNVSRIWNFPGDPVVKTLCFYCTERGFDPWLRN